MTTTHATAKWAQRKEMVFLTFEVKSCKDPQIVFEKDKIIFEGKGDATNKSYKNEVEMFDEIVPDECVWSKKPGAIECKIVKKNKDASFWPRLHKLKQKQHWLHTDFQKWKDESDSSDDEDVGSGMPMGMGDNDGLAQMMAQMGRGGGTAGMPAMDPNDMGDLDGDTSEEDSDDEDLPELQPVDDNDKAKVASEKTKENGTGEPAAQEAS